MGVCWLVVQPFWDREVPNVVLLYKKRDFYYLGFPERRARHRHLRADQSTFSLKFWQFLCLDITLLDIRILCKQNSFRTLPRDGQAVITLAQTTSCVNLSLI